MASTHKIGQRLSFDGALCTVRYVGEVAGTSGIWLGVEWDDASRGKHDGCHKGTRYFNCLSKLPTAASFVRPTRPSDKPRSFVAAVRDKYADDGPVVQEQIVFSGKVAEEVGFDKVRRRLAQLHELTTVIVDGARIATAQSPETGDRPVNEVCPRIAELDISRNLMSSFSTVVDICEGLPSLAQLRLNGNRFWRVLDHEPALAASAARAFSRVTHLALEETLLSCDEIFHITSWFTSLENLSLALNQLSVITSTPPPSLASSIVTLSLEYNDFTTLSDLSPLAAFTSLRNLHLKGNNISGLIRDTDPDTPAPVFSPSVAHLDVSYNQISSWSFVDALPDSFPGLHSLRLAHNPIYESPAPGGDAPRQSVAEDPYMITIARIAGLQQLNFSAVTAAERADAEMFYLSRIARQLAALPEDAPTDAVLRQHRRYAELCAKYGEPVVVRKREIGHAFLEGRLIKVEFYLPGSSSSSSYSSSASAIAAETRVVEIPRALDIYAVKGIAGKLFGIPPLNVRLVWETGEWDPVAGLDDGESSGGEEEEEEEKDEEEQEGDEGGQDHAEDVAPTEGGQTVQAAPPRHGRLVKRQLELADSPRQLGYCVDGNEARVRVERKKTLA